MSPSGEAEESVKRDHTDASPRVLVADDEWAAQMVAVLREYGYDADPAGDGREALERLRERPYALVITDVMMPRFDGFDLVKAMRKEPALAEIPIVMIIARSSDANFARETQEQLQLAGVLIMPRTEAKLLTVVREVLGPWPRPGAAPSRD